MDVLQKKGFTLVELVVVVVILGVLAAIGLVSYTSYLGGSRDSNRLTQLSDLRSGLNVYGINNRFPLPEDSVNILANANVIATQGYAGEKTLNLIGYSDGGTDPLDGTYFTYYLTQDKRDFQLMTFLEEENVLASSFISQTHAVSVDYSERIPAVTGKKLGTLVEDFTNTPVQEVASVVSVGDIDIATVGTVYHAYYEDDTILSGTGGVLTQIIPNRNCKRILEIGNNIGSNIYRISPTGVGSIQVYCDMETDGGGWTRVSVGAEKAQEPINAANFLDIGRDATEVLFGYTSGQNSTTYIQAIKVDIPDPSDLTFVNRAGSCVAVNYTDLVPETTLTAGTKYMLTGTLGFYWTSFDHYGITNASTCATWSNSTSAFGNAQSDDGFSIIAHPGHDSVGFFSTYIR